MTALTYPAVRPTRKCSLTPLLLARLHQSPSTMLLTLFRLNLLAAEPMNFRRPAHLLVSSVVYPDGSTFSFTYEPTPGNGAAVTARVKSITLQPAPQLRIRILAEIMASPAQTVAPRV